MIIVDGKKFYSRKEFANLLDAGVSTVRKWDAEGKITGLRGPNGKFVYYSEDDFRKMTSDLIHGVRAEEPMEIVEG